MTDYMDPNFLSTFAPPVPQPLGYHVVVKPKPATETKGMIALATRTKQAEMNVRTIGQILAIGGLAWKAEMRNSGLNFQSDPVMRDMKVGDWVVYRAHAGQRLKFTDEDTADEVIPFLLIMQDTDVIAKITEEQAGQLFDWV